MPERVRVLAIVRDQAWALPGHLQALAGQQVGDQVEVDFHYTHYGCTDASPVVLRRFAARAPMRITDGGQAPADGAADMATRCRLLNAATDDAVAAGCSHVLFIDPGVRLPVGALRALIDTGRPIVAPLLCADRSYDLPPAQREQNVYGGQPNEPLQAALGGVEGLQACLAATHIYLADRAALRSGVSHAPHPNGEAFGFALSALNRGVPIHALGSLRCEYAAVPEDLYLSPAHLAQTFCANGTVRVRRRGDRQVVTLGAMAVARALNSALATTLPQAIPGLGGATTATFTLSWPERFAQMEFGQPPSGAGQPPA